MTPRQARRYLTQPREGAGYGEETAGGTVVVGEDLIFRAQTVVQQFAA